MSAKRCKIRKTNTKPTQKGQKSVYGNNEHTQKKLSCVASLRNTRKKNSQYKNELKFVLLMY